jgi:hypothetical protein
MANLINATVYQIDGNPKDTAVVIAFDTNTIIIQEATVPTISEVTSVIEVKAAKLNAPTIKYYVEETVTELVALANTNGTTLVQATIASINDNPLKVNIQVALPANKVEILDFVSGSVNSYLQYGNDKYYATETKSTLVTAANTSSGGGGVESVTGFGVDNTDPLNPIVNKFTSTPITAAGTNYATATQIVASVNEVSSASNAAGIKLPSSPQTGDFYSVYNLSANGFIVYSTSGFVNQIIINNTVASSIQIPPNELSLYKFTYLNGYWSVNQEQVAPYKVYSAGVSQSSTGNPTATVLSNSLGATVAWTFQNTGEFVATASAAVFTSGKTFVKINSTFPNRQIQGYRATDTICQIDQQDLSGTSQNGLFDVLIEILVYP